MSRRELLVRSLTTQTSLVVIAVATLLLTTVVDYLTSSQLAFTSFYLIPVLLVSWGMGLRWGMGFAFLSSLCWYLTHLSSDVHSPLELHQSWNALNYFLGYFVAAYATGKLKEQLTRKGQLLEENARIGQELKEHVDKLEYSRQLYSALSQINQAIVHATGAQELLDQISRVLVEFGPFSMAWIGWDDPETHEVQVVSSFGDQTGYVSSLDLRSDDSPRGRGPTGTCIRENRTCVIDDFLHAMATSPWHDAAARAGYASSASIPIQRDGRACGALNVYAPELNFFGPEETSLLEEAAHDIAFSLDYLRLREEQEKAQQAATAERHLLRSIMDALPDFLFLKDPEGRYLDCNLRGDRRLPSGHSGRAAVRGPHRVVAAAGESPPPPRRR